jgi:hypothetical protein
LALPEWPSIIIINVPSRSAESRFDVLQDGNVVIETGSVPEVKWQLDGKEVKPVQASIKINLTKGMHTLRIVAPAKVAMHPRVRLASSNAKPLH